MIVKVILLLTYENKRAILNVGIFSSIMEIMGYFADIITFMVVGGIGFLFCFIRVIFHDKFKKNNW